jgi:hypothetical protein
MTIETDPLFVLIPEEDAEDAAADKLEKFIADALYRADIWDDPRTSDGITFWRVVERDPTRVRLSGRIYEISQVVHTFWLDLERDKERPEQVNWTLYFDIIPGSWSPRRISMAAEVIDVPEQVGWQFAIKGSAVVQAATLVVDSAYVIPIDGGEDTW